MVKDIKLGFISIRTEDQQTTITHVYWLLPCLSGEFSVGAADLFVSSLVV